MLNQMETNPNPRIYLSDFYTSGLDALAYTRMPFRAFSFCWAQTFDQYDFTYNHLLHWMRPWEVMAFSLYEKVFVACEGLKELISVAAPEYADKVHVVGLPFNSQHVASQWKGTSAPLNSYDVVYSSRWDREKSPNTFLDVVLANPDLKFAVCTGMPTLSGTDTKSVQRALTMREAGVLTIHENCTKNDYYGVLSRSKVQFNSALQDWVSFTLLEALTFGCKPLYPLYRSFPETLLFDDRHLYAPFDVGAATRKLRALLNGPADIEIQQPILEYHDGTLARIAEQIQ
jgi:hypothetical protein